MVSEEQEGGPAEEDAGSDQCEGAVVGDEIREDGVKPWRDF